MELQQPATGPINSTIAVTPPCGWNPTALAGQPATLSFASTITAGSSDPPSIAALQQQQIPVTLGTLIQYTNYDSAPASNDSTVPPFGLGFCNCGQMATGKITGTGCYSYSISVTPADPAAFQPAVPASAGTNYSFWALAPGSCTLTVPGLPPAA
jgi:hypothetical protein